MTYSIRRFIYTSSLLTALGTTGIIGVLKSGMDLEAINKMTITQRPEIERPAIFEEIGKAQNEANRLRASISQARTSPYQSTNYSRYITELGSNQIAQLERGLTIVESDISQMTTNPAISNYNRTCEIRAREEEVERASLIKTKENMKKIPYWRLGLSALGVLASFIAFNKLADKTTLKNPTQ